METVLTIAGFVGLFGAAGLSLAGLVFSIRKDPRWMKYFSFGLLVLAFTGSLFVVTLSIESKSAQASIGVLSVLSFVFWISYPFNSKDVNDRSKRFPPV